MTGALAISGNATGPQRTSFSRGFELGQASPHETHVTLIDDPRLASDAFLIEGPSSARTVCASSTSGFQYAGTTLASSLHATLKPEWHGVVQKPVFPERGVMLDISRNKVPTMESLRQLVEQLAAWKINHLQLYTEHTFAYRDHRAVWAGSSPMTADEVKTLDGWCRAYHIELAANQNSLGHLHRWLRHPDYIHLAEAPDGYTTPWGEKRSGPFSLNPVLPESLQLLSGWYDELFPNFTSEWVNVGCDEAFDLGQGASRSACEARGKGRVYLDYLMEVKKRVEARGRKMMFWGDIILHHPDMIPHLEKDLIALVWGYEADHPFEKECRAFAEATVPFWVCPGTSTWNSIAGRIDNALENMNRAASAGKQFGASGFMITEWGDNGHWQTMPFSTMALAAGAETAWTGKAPDARTLAKTIPDGEVICDLGRVYLDAGFPLHNTSPLFPLIRFSEPDKITGQWTIERLQQALDHLNECEKRIPDEAGRWREELRLGARMLRHAAERGLWLKNGRPREATKTLAREVGFILDELSRLWLERNRPGGLEESIEPLKMRQSEYQS